MALSWMLNCMLEPVSSRLADPVAPDPLGGTVFAPVSGVAANTLASSLLLSEQPTATRARARHATLDRTENRRMRKASTFLQVRLKNTHCRPAVSASGAID
jgi:hypothetical protein